MVEKDKVYDALIKAFISYQFRLENPMPTQTETPEVKRLKYMNDAVFNSKVKSLASGVMHVIDEFL